MKDLKLMARGDALFPIPMSAGAAGTPAQRRQPRGAADSSTAGGLRASTASDGGDGGAARDGGAASDGCDGVPAASGLRARTARDGGDGCAAGDGGDAGNSFSTSSIKGEEKI